MKKVFKLDPSDNQVGDIVKYEQWLNSIYESELKLKDDKELIKYL